MAISLSGNSKSTFSDEIAVAKNLGTGGTAGEAQIVGYQQGVWTPTLSAGTPGTSSFTPNVNNANTGVFVRVGNLITFTGNLTGTWSAGTASGAMSIGGLPYANSSTPVNGAYGALSFGYIAGFAGSANMTIAGGIISLNQTNATIYMRRIADLTGESHLPVANVGGGANAINTHFFGAYITNNTDWTPINGATVS